MSSTGWLTTMVGDASGTESFTRPFDDAAHTAPSPARSVCPSIGTEADDKTFSCAGGAGDAAGGVAGHDVVLAVLELLAVDVGGLLALGVGEAGALPPHAARKVTHRHAIPTPVRTGHPCDIARTAPRCLRR
jgi:hypothetical protein